MTVHIKNGTPLDAPSLCETCTRATVIKGHQLSEHIVSCGATSPEIRIEFRVRECSHYVDRTRQTLYEMNKIAWVLAPRGGKRCAGFVPPAKLGAHEDEIELILEND